MTYKIKCELIKTNGRVRYKKYRRSHYNVRIWIEASDDELSRVEQVVYRLHRSFRNPVRKSTKASTKFSIGIWTWGMFEAGATLYLKDGTQERLAGLVEYILPGDTGDNYEQI